MNLPVAKKITIVGTKRPFKKRKGLKRKITVTSLKKGADAVFSRFIRQKYADNEGLVTCYTCEYKNQWKKLQNGHFVSRYYLNTRYDERNCRPQCFTCNMYRNGMTPNFAVKLKEELGDGIVEELFTKARELVKNFNYQEIINKYKAYEKA